MNPYQKLFDAQKDHFRTGITRTYEWRVGTDRPHGEHARRQREGVAKSSRR
jgi:hypothetical protein